MMIPPNLPPMKRPVRVNVGCGPDYKRGFVNIDVTEDEGFRVDVVGSILYLPFAEATADDIYAGHVLEHIEWATVEPALQECRRVLKPGGRLCVVGPDVTRITDETPYIEAGWVLWGTQEHDADYHLWPCSGGVLARLIRDAGFVDVVEHDVPIPRWLVSYWRITGPAIPWQCCITATNPTEES